MKIVAFVGETFEFFNHNYYAKPTSAAFLQDAIGEDNVFVCSSSVIVAEQPTRFSTKVVESNFYPFHHYASTKDFVVKSVIKPGFFKAYTKMADDVIKQHTGAYFWIRTPSIGSIVFGLRALNAGEKVLHHMCADASNTWRDKKYSLPEKMFGYLLSRYIRFKLSKICRHKKTLNFCTGNILEEFSNQYAPESTYQFVDVMVQPPEISDITIKKSQFLNILFVARIVADKGVFDLLRLAARLKGNCRVTIVGDGPDLQAAIDYCDELSLDDIVNFKGQLPHTDLSFLYNSHDLVVVPSNNFYEGFPRVIMEAWSHHKPVVVSNVGGIGAFVKDSVNGLIFTAGDEEQFFQSVKRLINDEDLYKRISLGAADMSKYSVQKYWVNSLLEIISREESDEA